MRRDRPVVLGGVLFVAASLLAPGAAARKLIPEGAAVPVAIEVSGRAYVYYPVTSERPLVCVVDGPGSFDGIARWRFGEGELAADVEVELSLDGEPRVRQAFRAAPGRGVYPDRPWQRAGHPVRVVLDVPSGRHEVRVVLVRPDDGVLDLNPLWKAPARGLWTLVTRAELGAIYDSNAFRYSDPDVDDFLDGLREERFPIESVDDLRIDPSASLSLARGEPGVRSTVFTVEGDLRLAAVNGEKSFGKLSARVREEREHLAYLQAEYSYIPSYHIRHLWDEDAEGGDGAYRPCGFEKQALHVELGSDRSLPIDLAVGWTYEAYRYDRGFVEYDAGASTTSARAIARPARGLRIDLGYALRRSSARGYDEDGETRSTSDESDTTYDQDEYELRARWEMGRLWGVPAALRARAFLARRFYLTEKGAHADPDHAGRDDAYLTLGAGVEARLPGAATAELFVEWRSREAHSDVVPDIGETKDYGAGRIGLKLAVEGVHVLD